LGLYEFKREHWKTELYKLDKLAEIPKIRGPVFVFAHFMITHDPFVFDRDGGFVSVEESKRLTARDAYVNQVIFVNRKLQWLIDYLLSNSNVSPIIVIQADEGPFPDRYALNERGFDWRQATPGELRMKMGIINAYHLPHVDTTALYPSITPVNSFRLIFNCYFNGQFELLPDKSYAHKDDNHIYDFFDVTEIVK
jgi:hypothetical protein